MRTFFRSTLTFVTVGLVAFALSGCSPSAKKARLLDQANRYFADGNYDEAEIDYKNVLQVEPLNPQAIGQLGLLYFNQGRMGQSYAFVLKSKELQPNNLELRLKLAQLYFAFGQLKDAHDEVSYILERRPDDPEAILLLVDFVQSPKDIDDIRARLKALPAAATQGASVILALGILDFRQRHLKEAETAIEHALALDPKSIEAHTALAGVYRVKGDLTQAGKEYAAAAELSPTRSPHRLQYAQFKVQSGDYPGARKLLEEMTTKTPDYLPGLIVLAQLSAAEKKYAEAMTLIGEVLRRDPKQPEAMLLVGRVELAQGNPAKAIEDTQKMLQAYPKAAQGHHQLALAYLASNNPDKAAASLNQALTLSPNFTDAAILLAEINNRKKDYSSTIIGMKQVIQQHPELGQAWLLLADAYHGQGNLGDALAVYGEIEKRFPKLPQPPFLCGLIYVEQGKLAEARAAFNQALALAPDNLSAVERLVALDLDEKNAPAAIQRVEALIAKNPKRTGAYLLLARIHLTEKDSKQAEAVLHKAIALEPDSPDAYYLLASVYFNSDQTLKALDDLQALIAKNPHDPNALMLTGVLQDERKDYAAARDSYEKLLAINPKSVPALNNLAYLYAEHFNELDKGLEAAQKARELQPQEPHAADTLGWILYRKHQYVRALALLDESAGKLPDSAEIQYHLGMAQYMTGDEDAAQATLQHALQLSQAFPGVADARKSLALLAVDATPGNRAMLEQAVADRADDPVALARLGATYEQAGAADKAIETYQKALEANPANAKAMLGLVRLYSGRQDTAKALEFAKAARKAAPSDPGVAHALGNLAFQTGDFTWAASLLQESAMKLPNDADALYDYAQAAYSVGRVADAQAAAQSALDANASFARSGQARHLLEMIVLAANPSPASAAKVDEALKADATNVPALMALAALDLQKGNAAGAKEADEKALARYPNFTPAKRGLAIYYAENPGDDQTAFDLGTKAREAFPDDAELAKALGMIVYRRGEFPRAAGLLSESAASRPNDAELIFYLGMAQSRLKNTAASKQSLKQALSLGLKGDLAAEAKKTLAELK